jgi:DNA repair protein RadC
MAVMHSGAANDCIGEPCCPIHGFLHSSSGLPNDASIIELPKSHNIGGWNLALSAKEEKERRRFNVAKLIGLVCPEEATSIAGAILNEFGSLAKAMAVTVEAQRRVVGNNENVIALLAAIRKANIDDHCGELYSSPIKGTDERLINYLVSDLGFRSNETLRAFFLDSSNHLIADEIIAEGTVRQLQFYPRRIFKRAFEVNASGLIIAHNHPGGSPRPSGSDIQATKTIAMMGVALDLIIHDHIIVAGNKWTSFKAAGLLS